MTCVRGVIVLTLTLCSLARAVDFAGGTGEPNDPYQIATAAQLIGMGSDPNLTSKCFKLTADIDLAGTTRAQPLITSFTGTLDGNGHTIRNLRITGVGAQGLFAYLRAEVRVSNLHLLDVDILSTNYAGGLAAENAGTVVNCSITGFVAAMGHDVGGLIGRNQGTITACRSAADVMGTSPVGGLVGNNMGFVSQCSSTGQVVGEYRVGGLLGRNMGFTSKSCSSAVVTGSDEVGGLAGDSYGGAVDSYALGAVAGSSNVGGLIGANYGRLVSCYATASVSSQTTSVGFLVGRNSPASGSNVTNCYFAGPSHPSGPASTLAGTGLSAEQMKQRASYVGWDFWGTEADGAADIWFLPADAAPALAWQTETTGLVAIPDLAGLVFDEAGDTLTATGLAVGIVSSDYHRTIPGGNVISTYPHSLALPGSMVDLVLSLGNTYDWTWNPGIGAVKDPYQIQTPGELESLGDHPELWGNSFILTADLDMAGRTYSGALIAPDVNSATGFQGVPFTGNFNGNLHTIRNLRMVHDSLSPAACFGLFGKIDTTGGVLGLTLKDTAILAGTRTTYAGALAAYNSGVVNSCSATGVITAGSGGKVGGLVGSDSGSTVNCQADVIIVRVSDGTATRGS